MDLNLKRELVEEIIERAECESQKPPRELSLIDILSAFDLVLGKSEDIIYIESHNIDAENSDAIALYRTLLKLGRNNLTWDKKLEMICNESLFNSECSSTNGVSIKLPGDLVRSSKKFEFLGSFGGREKAEISMPNSPQSSEQMEIVGDLEVPYEVRYPWEEEKLLINIEGSLDGEGTGRWKEETVETLEESLEMDTGRAHRGYRAHRAHKVHRGVHRGVHRLPTETHTHTEHTETPPDSYREISLPKLHLSDLLETHSKSRSNIHTKEGNKVKPKPKGSKSAKPKGSKPKSKSKPRTPSTGKSKGKRKEKVLVNPLDTPPEISERLNRNIINKRYTESNFRGLTGKYMNRDKNPIIPKGNIYIPERESEGLVSNLQLAETFNRKNILMRIWNQWLIWKMNITHTRFLVKVAHSHRLKTTLKTIFNMWKGVEEGGRAYRKALLLSLRQYKMALTRRSLHGWNRLCHQYKQFNLKLDRFLRMKERKRSRLIFSSWNTLTYENKLFTIQRETAIFKSRARVKRKVIGVWKNFTYYMRRKNMMIHNAYIMRRGNLIIKGLHGFKHSWKISLQKQMLQEKIEKYGKHLRLKYNFRTLKRNSILKMLHGKLDSCSHRYKGQLLLHKAFYELHKYTLFKKGKDWQEIYVFNYYKNKTLQKSFRHLFIYTRDMKNKRLKAQEQHSIILKTKSFYGWKLWFEEHKISGPPGTESFVHCAYKWIRNSLGYAPATSQPQLIFTNSNESMASNSSIFTTAPNAAGNKLLMNVNMKLNPQPHYMQLFYESNCMLARSVLRECLLAWRERSSHVKQFRREREAKKLATLFYSLRRLLKRKIWKKYASHGHLHYIQNKRKYAIIEGLRRFAQTKKLNRRKYNFINNKHQKRERNDYFDSWLLYIQNRKLLKHKYLLINSKISIRKKEKFYRIWENKYSLVQKRKKLENIHKEYLCRFLMGRWRMRYMEKGQNHITKEMANNKYSERILKHALQSLHLNIVRNHWKEAGKRIAYEQYSKWVKERIWNYWKYVRPTLRQNNILTGLAYTAHQMQLIQKSLKVLSYNVQFQYEKGLRQDRAINEVQKVKSGQVLRAWRQWTNNIKGSKYLAQLFNFLYKNKGFARIQLHVQIERNAEQNMHKYYVRTLCSKVLKSLKILVAKDKLLCDCAEQIYSNDLLFTKKKFFSTWRELFNKYNRGYLIYSFCAIQIKNVIMEKYLNGWSLYVANQRKKKIAIIYRISKLERRVFTSWRIFEEKQIKENTLIRQIQTDQNQTLITKYFHDWYAKYFDIKLQNMREQHLERRKKVRILHHWQDLCAHKSEIYAKQEKLFNLRVHRQKVYFINSLRGITQESKIKTHKNKLSREHYVKTILSKLFYNWYAFYTKNYPQVLKIKKFRKNLRNNVLQRYLQIWFSSSSLKIQKYRAVILIANLFGKSKRKSYIYKWAEGIKDLHKYDDKINKAKGKICKVEEKFVFKRLFAFVRNKKIYMKLRARAMKFYYNKLLSLSFSSLRYTSEKTRKNVLKQVTYSEMLNSKSLLSAFSKLKLYSNTKKRIKNQSNKLRSILRKKNCPHAFEALRVHSEIRMHWKKLENHAINHYCEDLEVKALGGLMENHSKQMHKRQNEEIGFKFYMKCLIKKTLTSWYGYKIYRDQLSQKRAILGTIIQKTDKEITLGKCWKGIIRDIEQTREELEGNKKKLRVGSKSRIFKAWRNYVEKRRSKRERVTKCEHKQIHNAKYTHFSKWRRTFLSIIRIRYFREEKEKTIKYLFLFHLHFEWKWGRVCRNIFNRWGTRIKRDSLAGWKEWTLQRQIKGEKINIIQSQHEISLKMKTLDGLRQHRNIWKRYDKFTKIKGQGLLQKSLLGFQQNLILMKNSNVLYIKWRAGKLLKCFKRWGLVYKLREKRRLIIGNTLQKKKEIMQIQSMKIWGQQAMRIRSSKLIYDQIVLPKLVKLMGKMLLRWRHYASFRSSKTLKLQNVTEQKNAQILRSVFTVFKSAQTAYRENMKKANAYNSGRITRLKKRCLISLNTITKKLIKLKTLNEAYNIGRVELEKERYFCLWKNVLYYSKILGKFHKRQEIHRKRGIMEKWKMFVRMKTQKTVSMEEMKGALNNWNNSEIKLGLTKLFKDSFPNAISESLFTKYYFQQWKFFSDYRIYIKELKDNANYFLSRNLIEKYWIQFRERYEEERNLRLKKQHLDLFKTEVMTKKCFVILIKYKTSKILGRENTKIANSFRSENSLKKSFTAIDSNRVIKEYKRGLNSIGSKLEWKRSLTAKYNIWKLWKKEYKMSIDFHQKQEILEEIQIQREKIRYFRRLRGKTRKHKYLRETCQTASLYFAEKRAQGLMQKSLRSLKEHGNNKQVKKQNSRFLENLGGGFYRLELMKKVFKAWREELEETNLITSREFLFNIFQGWKYIVKEKKLLRKYLKECNAIDDKYLHTPITTFRHDLPHLPLIEDLSASEMSLGETSQIKFQGFPSHSSSPQEHFEPLQLVHSGYFGGSSQETENINMNMNMTTEGKEIGELRDLAHMLEKEEEEYDEENSENVNTSNIIKSNWGTSEKKGSYYLHDSSQGKYRSRSSKPASRSHSYISAGSP